MRSLQHLSWLTVLRCALLACACCHRALAQSAAALPDAPLPKASATTGDAQPAFRLPPGTPVVLAAPKDLPPPPPVEDTFCAAPSDNGWKLGHTPEASLSEDEKQELRIYIQKWHAKVQNEWARHVPLWSTSQFSRERALMVRFDIQDDGSIQHLRLMMSSGKKGYDQAALKSIRKVAPFDQLPLTDGPLHMCVNFLFNSQPAHGLPADPFKTPPSKHEPDSQPAP